MSEAALYKEGINLVDYTPSTAKTGGEVVQLADGRAGVVGTTLAAADTGVAYVMGIFTMLKTASVVILNGQKLYWVKSTGMVSYTGDFYVGVAVEDATAAATTVKVALNVEQVAVIQQGVGRWNKLETLGGLDQGVGVTDIGGGTTQLAFDAVVEIATAALFSEDTIALDQKPIFEGWVGVFDKGDDAALDINVGVANAHHATNFDSVTEQVSIHLDGNDATIFAESDDGTTEVAATTTAVESVDDTYFFLQIDMRVLTDIQMYINGVNVLPATVFALGDATGPILIVAEIEKSSNDTPADVRVKDLVLRTGITA